MKPTPGPWTVKLRAIDRSEVRGPGAITVAETYDSCADRDANPSVIVAAVNALFKVKPDATVKEYEDFAAQIPAMMELVRYITTGGWSPIVAYNMAQNILASAGIEWRET